MEMLFFVEGIRKYLAIFVVEIEGKTTDVQHKNG